MAIGLVIFLLILPFHLVVKRLLPGPVGTYWKEILLGLLMVLWAICCVRERKLLLSDTPLDTAVLAYLGLLLLRFVLDVVGLMGPKVELRTSAWGLYESAMYLPLFWLVPTALRGCSEQSGLGRFFSARNLTAFLICLGAVVAVGGLLEFVLDVPLWPSDELLQRQGFSDVFIYGTNVRRVYFTLDSPTAMANILAVILPLALAVVLLGRQTKVRVTTGIAAVLMGACIIVTFSRGIWVATAAALLVMGLLSYYLRPPARSAGNLNRRALLVAAAALVLVAGVWGLVTVLRPGQSAPAYPGVVELSPADYEAAPVNAVSQELLETTPDYGKADLQAWTLLDPITGQDDTRMVLYEHPPEHGKVEIIYRVAVPEAGAMRFAIALAPETWSPEKGDGVSFQVHVAETDAASSEEEGEFVFVRYINPKLNPSDRRWRNFLVDLSPWAGREVNLSLIIDGGPAEDYAFDWAGWAELQVVSVKPGYFAANQSNVILRHTRSILDWARDETNRDRLAAWSLAWDAWRAAPLWGNGLGSTGAAALRTRPESAFVTESQVLKALVELGLPGLLVLGYLWFQIGHIGYRAYRAADESEHRILLGILIGLLVVFIEGWVYQNLEVKQVNALFWTLVGTLGYLACTRDE